MERKELASSQFESAPPITTWSLPAIFAGSKLSEGAMVGRSMLHWPWSALSVRESAYWTLVMVHLRKENYEEAPRQYDRYRTQLHPELGVAWSSHIRDLVLSWPGLYHATATLLSRHLCEPYLGQPDRPSRRVKAQPQDHP